MTMTINIEQARQRILEAEREVLGVAYPKTIEIVRTLFGDIEGLKGRHREWDKVKKVLVAAELLPPDTSVGTLRQYFFAIQKERRDIAAVDAVPEQAPTPKHEALVAIEPKADKRARPGKAEKTAAAAVSTVVEGGAAKSVEPDLTPPSSPDMTPEDFEELLAQAHARDAAPVTADLGGPGVEEDEPEGGDATALLLRATEQTYTDRGQPFEPIVNPNARVDSRIAAMARPRSRGRAMAMS